MTIVEPAIVAVEDEPASYVQWGPAIAGALAAAALAFVLHSFAAAIGLAVASTAPTWRDSSAMLHVLSGIYLVLAAIASFGLGGYIAGRLRTSWDGTAEETEFRDGTHGLLVWAIGLVLTVLLTAAAAQSLTRLAAPAASAPSVAGENIIAYDLDRLFRAERRPQDADLTYPRSEAARIILTSAGHTGMAADDRAYLVRLTAATTGLPPAEAQQRVDTTVAQALDNIRKARRAAVILAFMAGAAALVGAAVAWWAACTGGEHRDGRAVPTAPWGLGARRATTARP